MLVASSLAERGLDPKVKWENTVWTFIFVFKIRFGTIFLREVDLPPPPNSLKPEEKHMWIKCLLNRKKELKGIYRTRMTAFLKANLKK